MSKFSFSKILKNSHVSPPPPLYKTLRVLVSDFYELQDMDLWVRNYYLSLIERKVYIHYNSLLHRQILVRKNITTRKQLIAVNVNEPIPAQTPAVNSLEGLKR